MVGLCAELLDNCTEVDRLEKVRFPWEQCRRHLPVSLAEAKEVRQLAHTQIHVHAVVHSLSFAISRRVCLGLLVWTRLDQRKEVRGS